MTKTSEQLFRLYARLGMAEAQRDMARRERDELARLLEAAADREVAMLSQPLLSGDQGPVGVIQDRAPDWEIGA